MKVFQLTIFVTMLFVWKPLFASDWEKLPNTHVMKQGLGERLYQEQEEDASTFLQRCKDECKTNEECGGFVIFAEQGQEMQRCNLKRKGFKAQEIIIKDTYRIIEDSDISKVPLPLTLTWDAETEKYELLARGIYRQQVFRPTPGQVYLLTLDATGNPNADKGGLLFSKISPNGSWDDFAGGPVIEVKHLNGCSSGGQWIPGIVHSSLFGLSLGYSEELHIYQINCSIDPGKKYEVTFHEEFSYAALSPGRLAECQDSEGQPLFEPQTEGERKKCGPGPGVQIEGFNNTYFFQKSD
jgi:hypothetical protein